ncbi:hypothetical protein ABZ644_24865 [Nocardiopsis alba]|uniref:hypothetical protein n=1 Tax=Nocardiopsis alba TaxID=53437 RepID=UPI0033F7608E
MPSRTRTFDPGFNPPVRPVPPKPLEIPASYKNFSFGSHCLFLVASLVSFVVAVNMANDNPGLLFLPFLPILIGVYIVARIVRGIWCNYRLGWHQQSQIEFEKEKIRYRRNIENLSGDVFVDSRDLGFEDRARLEQAQGAVEYILKSEIHRSGKILDVTKNKVVLRDLEWQIAKDCLRADRADRKLQEIGRPKSDNLQAKDSYEQAQKALEALRSEIGGRVVKIVEYADQVRCAENLMDDENRVVEYNEIFTELQVETAAGAQQDAALNSLIEAQKVGLEVVEMHAKLGL